jgi:excisionase family DNA binding protein
MAGLDAEERLETPKQLANRVGLSERKVRHLIQTRQLEHIMIGCRVHIPVGAFTRFLDARKVTPSCQDETRDRGSAGSPSGRASTLPGPSTVAAASAALARQTAHKLKSPLRNGCNGAGTDMAPVTRLRSS